MRFLFIILILLCTQVAYTQTSNTNQETVVLIHGFGRDADSMAGLSNWFKNAGYGVEQVEYESLTQNMDEIKKEVFDQIDRCCLELMKVHFVGHSIGGLLIRSYLGENNISNLGRVVLIGTPNKGWYDTEIFDQQWLPHIAIPVLMDIAGEDTDFLNSLEPPYYDLGVIAGDIGIGVIEFLLGGPNDGLVRVESTQVEGMKDFVIVRLAHYDLRSKKIVADHAINFLKHGSFTENQ